MAGGPSIPIFPSQLRNRVPHSWFADEQMYVLGHEDVACDDQPVRLTNAFERLLHEAVAVALSEQWLPLVATERAEVKLAGVLVTDKTLWHAGSSVTQVRGFPPMSPAARTPWMGHPANM